MAISLKPAHLKRYKDIAWLLVKYGRRDLASRHLSQKKPAPFPGPAWFESLRP